MKFIIDVRHAPSDPTRFTLPPIPKNRVAHGYDTLEGIFRHRAPAGSHVHAEPLEGGGVRITLEVAMTQQQFRAFAHAVLVEQNRTIPGLQLISV